MTGIFAKAAGVEGAKADRLSDVIKSAFATVQTIPRAGLPSDIAQAAAACQSRHSSRHRYCAKAEGAELRVAGGAATGEALSIDKPPRRGTYGASARSRRLFADT